MNPDVPPTGGLAGSGLTRALSTLGAVAVTVLGVAAVVYWLLAADLRTLLVGASLVVLVVGAVFYGARRARRTKTPYWRT